ncbi:hypothetical protein Tco_1453070, partial [Tanacetum coccineum]
RRWVVGNDFRLAVHKCANSVEYQSALGKVFLMAINKGMQQGLKAGVVHGQVGRPLTQIEAYDLEVEGKYVEAVSEFEIRAKLEVNTARLKRLVLLAEVSTASRVSTASILLILLVC